MATFEKYMGLDSLASFGCIRSMHARSYIVTSTAMTAHMIHLFRLTTTACGLEIHDHTRKIIYKSKISTNGWTYAGQYLCDGWVHNLEVTLLLLTLLPIPCFRFRETIWRNPLTIQDTTTYWKGKYFFCRVSKNKVGGLLKKVDG